MRKAALLSVLVLLLCASCFVTPEDPPVTTYVVSFVTNTEAVIEDKTVEEGKTVTAPTTPENEGYVFDGWYADAAFSEKYNFKTKVTSDLILYAKWTLIVPSTVKWAGIRFSQYGIRRSYGKDNFPGPDTTAGLMDKMASCYDDSTGACILIVGTISTVKDDYGNVVNGRCSLDFPLSKKIDNASGSKKDFYEDYLTAMDNAGQAVWLQVEPGDADLEALATEVLSRYKHHPCVKGFGIDVEWYEYRKKYNEEEGDSSKLSNTTAEKVLDAVHAINPDYTLFVKHWDYNWLPSRIDGIIYVDDWQMFKSKQDAVNVFSGWANRFAPNPVMFQIGYDADEWIWSKFDNPAQEFGQMIVDGCYSGNDVGIIWVDFTLKDVMDKIKTEETV